MCFRDQMAICDWTRKKRKPKFKPRPHCLGNKCNSKLSLTLFSPHPAHLTWFGPTLSCFVLLCSALDTIHSCISLSVLYLSQQYSFCTDYTCTWKPYVNLRQKLPLKNNIKWICDLKFGLQRKNNDVKTTMIISTVMIIDVFSIKTFFIFPECSLVSSGRQAGVVEVSGTSLVQKSPQGRRWGVWSSPGSVSPYCKCLPCIHVWKTSEGNVQVNMYRLLMLFTV